jgi:hypothetical protein
MSDFMEDLTDLTLEWLYNEIPEIKPQKQDLDLDEKQEQP